MGMGDIQQENTKPSKSPRRHTSSSQMAPSNRSPGHPPQVMNPTISKGSFWGYFLKAPVLSCIDIKHFPPEHVLSLLQMIIPIFPILGLPSNLPIKLYTHELVFPDVAI